MIIYDVMSPAKMIWSYIDIQISPYVLSKEWDRWIFEDDRKILALVYQVFIDQYDNVSQINHYWRDSRKEWLWYAFVQFVLESGIDESEVYTNEDDEIFGLASDLELPDRDNNHKELYHERIYCMRQRVEYLSH